ncbi:hypothetical protein [Spiroplasma endosymbiont of Andrena trimmerana]|uniref:hypothetical protein n=1 Tax=Spiroplasma endosymbiont of Andrena trimmerana TaxID=3066316 RepID=UPI0030D07D3D
MKQLLITLSTLTTLTLTSSSIINTIDVTNTTVNKLLTNKSSINDTLSSVLNNQYGYLSSSDWITNQIDNNYYSYDTSHADYLLSDGKTSARTLFTVDNKGELVYKKDAVIPPKDKVEVDATKQEMITHKKITTVKDKYNPYSKSEYSNKYFSGDNTDWQYIQFGGVEKHIDISQQAGADKVEHSSSLSETLGLYYIAKAAKNNLIDNTIANKIGQYFMTQSSLKGQINDNLINIIINLISSNNNVFNFIYSAPMNVNDKNYSINYIFDKDNNLIEVYYTEFDKSNIENSLNYKWNDSYNWFSSNYSDYSNTYTIVKWTDYASDWNTFTNKYPTFIFAANSYLKVSTGSGKEDYKSLNSQVTTTNIKTNQQKDIDNSIFQVNISTWPPYDPNYPGGVGTAIDIYLELWHDDNNIYWKWHIMTATFLGSTSYSDIKLNNITFNNIMN